MTHRTSATISIILRRMYKLLALDIDGTLIAHDGTLPEANITAIRNLHARGVRIVLASGRADISIAGISERILEPDDQEYFIAYNGARVVTARSRRLLVADYVSAESVHSVVGYCREHGLYLQGYEADDFLVEEVTQATAEYAASAGMKYREVPDLARALPEGSPKMLIIGPHDVLEQHREALSRRGMQMMKTGGSLPRSGFSVMYSKPHFLEVVPSGVDKGTALAALAGRLGLTLSECVAAGDAGNDEGMVRAAGLGLCPADGQDQVKAVADEVLRAPSTQGIVAEIAERYFSS